MIKNVGESVRQRLRNAARSQGVMTQPLFDRYAYTAFLRRLSLSSHAEFFTLKGGLMMLVLDGEASRPTKDVDLDGTKPLSSEDLQAALTEILAVEPEVPDGVVFGPVIKMVKDRTNADLPGAKIQLTAWVGTAKVAVNVDVGFGNVVTPNARLVSIPTLLGDEAEFNLMRYPVETSIAEKMRAMIHHGVVNTRLKDYFDIHHYAKTQSFDGEILAQALVNTCEKFRTPLPRLADIPSLQPEHRSKFEPQWAAFIKSGGLSKRTDLATFEQCSNEILTFLTPVFECIHDATSPGCWNHETGKWLSEVVAGAKP
jgi:hypothetical protein